MAGQVSVSAPEKQFLLRTVTETIPGWGGKSAEVLPRRGFKRTTAELDRSCAAPVTRQVRFKRVQHKAGSSRVLGLSCDLVLTSSLHKVTENEE